MSTKYWNLQVAWASAQYPDFNSCPNGDIKANPPFQDMKWRNPSSSNSYTVCISSRPHPIAYWIIYWTLASFVDFPPACHIKYFIDYARTYNINKYISRMPHQLSYWICKRIYFLECCKLYVQQPIWPDLNSCFRGSRKTSLPVSYLNNKYCSYTVWTAGASATPSSDWSFHSMSG